MRLMTVIGTRPEAMKMAPILLTLKNEPSVTSLLCVTAQHRELLDQVLRFFGLKPDYDLDLMEPDQPLNGLMAKAVLALDGIYVQAAPDRVIVHGDTTTAMSAALAAHHRGIPVAHVEAGLRTYSTRTPWPEELNRRAIDLASDLHFAPTLAAQDNLLGERLHGSVFVTGNSGIDALHLVTDRLRRDAAFRRMIDAGLPHPSAKRRLVLVTAHRRESLGAPLRNVCTALRQLAQRDDVEIVYPVHPNPALRGAVEDTLGGRPNIHLLPSLDPASFVRLMQRADLILTDSGGVQEEAVTLGKPVLVLRDATERPEGISAGAARLAGTHPSRLLRRINVLLDAPVALPSCTILYGDGRASQRIVDALLGRPVSEFGSPPEAARDRLVQTG